MHCLVVGCGYLGGRVAQRWRAAGRAVYALTRSTARANQFHSQGLEPLVADVTRPVSLAPLGGLNVDTVLFAVGYDRTATPSIHEAYAHGLRNVLDALPDATRRVIYVSTTGVYGPAGGGWVDEQTPPNPQREGGRASLAAEQALAESRFGERGVVLRLAGLYGPARVPFLRELQAGEPIQAPSAGWLNLIHVDDAAAVVTMAASREIENGSQLFCVSDGAPVRRTAYYGEVARLLGADPPAFVDPPADSPRAARAASDKRISNRRLHEALQIDLAYPSYREGLTSILGNARPNR